MLINFKFIRAITRRCINPTVVKGIHIPKGLIITVDVLTLHFNPKYWEGIDPKDFNPLR